MMGQSPGWRGGTAHTLPGKCTIQKDIFALSKNFTFKIKKTQLGKPE